MAFVKFYFTDCLSLFGKHMWTWQHHLLLPVQHWPCNSGEKAVHDNMYRFTDLQPCFFRQVWIYSRIKCVVGNPQCLRIPMDVQWSYCKSHCDLESGSNLDSFEQSRSHGDSPTTQKGQTKDDNVISISRQQLCFQDESITEHWVAGSYLWGPGSGLHWSAE